MPTPTLEEYLETIYKLSAETGTARPTQIAEAMGVSGPTVTATLGRLEARDLVIREGRAVRLTEAGTVQALDIVRKHRIAETFLVDVLGLDWEAAHEDACLLEHAMSARVLEALEAYLDNPDVCPHGHPIPSATGIIAEESGRSLADLEAGEMGTILRVAEEEDVLSYLGERGLKPQVSVRVKDRDLVGGLLVLEIDDVTRVLALDIARYVTVDQRF